MKSLLSSDLERRSLYYHHFRIFILQTLSLTTTVKIVCVCNSVSVSALYSLSSPSGNRFPALFLTQFIAMTTTHITYLYYSETLIGLTDFFVHIINDKFHLLETLVCKREHSECQEIYPASRKSDKM